MPYQHRRTYVAPSEIVQAENEYSRHSFLLYAFKLFHFLLAVVVTADCHSFPPSSSSTASFSNPDSTHFPLPLNRSVSIPSQPIFQSFPCVLYFIHSQRCPGLIRMQLFEKKRKTTTMQYVIFSQSLIFESMFMLMQM